MVSFRSRLALIAFAVAATFILGLATVSLWLGERILEEQQAESDQAVFATFAQLAGGDLSADHLQLLTSAAERLAHTPTIASLSIIDSRDRVIASSDPSLVDTELGDLGDWQRLAINSAQGPAQAVMRRSPRSWRRAMLPRFAALAIITLLATVVLVLLGSGHFLRTFSEGLADRDLQIRMLTDELPLGLCYVDSKLRMQFANRTLERWLGWKRRAMIGRHLSEILSDEHFKDTLNGIRPALQGERVQRERHFVIDGAPAVIAAMNIPDRDPAGRVRGVFSLLRNVTDRRAQEDRSQQLLTQLAAKNAELESFSYTVSHDLKGPLATIVGCADLIELQLDQIGLLEGEAATALGDDIHQIRHAAAIMRKMLDELLELARVGLVANQESLVDLRQLAEDTVRLLAGNIDRHGTAVQIDAELPTVIGDRQRLQRVLLNLVDNAVKFSAGLQSPRVEIGLRRDREETVLFVRDNGRGIALEQQAQIFELFRKLDSGSEGTGIGLSIVQRIIHVHGGRIWVESAGVGHGTSFCFTLPEADNRRSSGSHAKLPSSGTSKVQGSSAYPRVRGSSGYAKIQDSGGYPSLEGDAL